MDFFKFYTMDIHYTVLELILTKSVNVNYQCNANYFNLAASALYEFGKFV